MADEVNNLMLDLLRVIRADIGNLKDDMNLIKVRTTSIEEGLAGVHRRLDKIDARVERIEKRLDLVDA